jgi:hypothetical protein
LQQELAGHLARGEPLVRLGGTRELEAAGDAGVEAPGGERARQRQARAQRRAGDRRGRSRCTSGVMTRLPERFFFLTFDTRT